MMIRFIGLAIITCSRMGSFLIFLGFGYLCDYLHA
jgi:hypothetical protein